MENNSYPAWGLFSGPKGVADELRVSEDIFGNHFNNNIFRFTEHTIYTFEKPEDFDNQDSWFNDQVNSYKVNSYGHRSNEYTGQVDLITSGCSQTYGLGVPRERVWSSIVAESLGMSHANVAAPGWSVQTMVSSIMGFINLYGKPKKIVLLIPDFKRMIFPLRHGVNSFNAGGKKIRVGQQNGAEIANLNFSSDRPKDANGPRDKYIKLPYDLYETLPFEVPFFFSAQALLGFIDYCKAANIDLIWSSWDHAVLKLYRNISLEGFNSLDMSGFLYRTDPLDPKQFNAKYGDCHGELEETYGENFKVAIGNPSHMNIHQHAHLAEEFITFINKRLEI